MKGQLQNKLKNKPKNKRGNKLQNEKGSALAYVLIFGMVIMVLVLGLLSVSKSGIAFSQESVENRQAYIDAKSVIEFGKVEINRRKTALGNAEEKLNGLYDTYRELVENEASQASINQKISEINIAKGKRDEKVTELKAPLPIFADPKKIAETLSKSSGMEEVGDLTVESPDDLRYTFTIKTKNLRRTLDYQVSFNYQGASKKEDPRGPVIRPEDKSYWGEWIRGAIFKESEKVHGKFDGLTKVSEDNKKLTINEPSNSLDIKDKFEWIHGRTLDMTAQNIKVTKSFPKAGVDSASNISHFNLTAQGKAATETEAKIPGEIRIIDEYEQKNKGLNKMTAEGGNIIFEKELEIGDKGQLEIESKTIFIKDDLELKSGGAKLTIDADDVVIEGEIELKSGAEMTITCKNIWIDKEIELESANTKLKIVADNIFIKGNIELKSGADLSLSSDSSSHIELKNITTESSKAKITIEKTNYLSIGDLSLGDKAEVTVTGAPGKNNNQMISGLIKPDSGNAHDLKFKNFALFDCRGLELNDNSTLELESDCVLIGGDLSLSFMKKPIRMTTQYLDVTGKTTISRMKEDLIISPTGNQDLNVRFNGGYEQLNSMVVMNQADLVIFSGEIFELYGDNANRLSFRLSATDIFINSKMVINQHWNGIYSGFEYTGKNSGATNLHILSDFTWKPQNDVSVIKSGSYNEVFGNFPGMGQNAWLYDLLPTTYIPPEFPAPPVIAGGSGGSEPGSGSGPANGSGGGAGSGSGDIVLVLGSITLDSASEKYY